jgi:hypothetical protein
MPRSVKARWLLESQQCWPISRHTAAEGDRRQSRPRQNRRTDVMQVMPVAPLHSGDVIAPSCERMRKSQDMCIGIGALKRLIFSDADF